LEKESIYDIILNSKDEIFIGSSHGVYYSSDNGNNWKQTINGFEDLEFMRIFTIAGDSKGNLYSSTRYQGIYRSIDNGKTWQLSNKGFTGAGVADFAFDKKGNIYLASTGVFKMYNNNDIIEYKGLHQYHISAVACNLKGDIFCGGGSIYGIYRSIDGGDTWELKADSNGHPSAVHSIVINKDGQIFTSSGTGWHCCSTDNGNTWKYLSPPGLVNKLGINNEGHIFSVGYSGTISRSTDNGDSWSELHKDYNYHELETIIFHPYLPIGYAAGTRGGMYGVLKTTNNGNTWFKPDENFYSSDNLAVDSLGNFWRWYVRTTDDGKTWEVIESGLKTNS